MQPGYMYICSYKSVIRYMFTLANALLLVCRKCFLKLQLAITCTYTKAHSVCTYIWWFLVLLQYISNQPWTKNVFGKGNITRTLGSGANTVLFAPPKIGYSRVACWLLLRGTWEVRIANINCLPDLWVGALICSKILKSFLAFTCYC